MTQEGSKFEKYSKLYDKYYKVILVIPLILFFLSLGYLIFFYFKTGDLIYKDTSLAGGTTITLNNHFNIGTIQDELKSKFPDVSIRTLTDLRTGAATAYIIESGAKPEDLKQAIENTSGIKLTDMNSSIEFAGPSLSNSFYKQLVIALVIAFILMSVVVFFSFRTFIPSLAVIFAAFADIVMPLALLNYFGLPISAAGISAFLMLIGYSVDTDILLTARALRKGEGTLNRRIYGAFKTGSFMTLTALVAVVPAFLIVTGLPESFRQIFFILALGLVADLINTWLTNASIIKWYCDSKKIE